RGLPLLVFGDRLAGDAVHDRVVRGERGGQTADRNGAALETDRDEASEDVREEGRRRDVHAEAVGPHLCGVGHDELEDRGLEVPARGVEPRSEEHTSELQSLRHLVCRLLLEKKKKKTKTQHIQPQTQLPLPPMVTPPTVLASILPC